MALGAKELSPTVFCHRWRHFFFLRVFVTIRALSIFLRKWANFVAGLRAVCRSFPVISLIPFASIDGD